MECLGNQMKRKHSGSDMPSSGCHFQACIRHTCEYVNNADLVAAVCVQKRMEKQKHVFSSGVGILQWDFDLWYFIMHINLIETGFLSVSTYSTFSLSNPPPLPVILTRQRTFVSFLPEVLPLLSSVLFSALLLLLSFSGCLSLAVTVLQQSVGPVLSFHLDNLSLDGSWWFFHNLFLWNLNRRRTKTE